MLEGLKSNRLVRSVALAAALHAAPVAATSETSQAIIERTIDVAKGIRNTTRGVIRSGLGSIHAVERQVEQHLLLNEMRDSINRPDLHLGSLLLRADELEFADVATANRERAEAQREYNQLLSQVNDLVHNQHVALWDAIPRVTGHLAYNRGEGSLIKFLKGHQGRCFPIALVNVALARDSGMKSVYLRFYAPDPNTGVPHVAGVIRFADGQEIDLNAGGWAYPGGVSMPYTAIPELYAAQHNYEHHAGQPLHPIREDESGRRAMLAGPHVPADQYYPDPGVFFAEHAINVFRNVNATARAGAGRSVENSNVVVRGSTREVTTALQNNLLEAAARADTSASVQRAASEGRLVYWDTSPLPSASVTSTQTDAGIEREPSREIVELNNLIGVQTQQNMILRDDAALMGNARLIGLHRILQERVRAEPQGTRRYADMLRFSQASMNRLRQDVHTQMERLHIRGQQRAMPITTAFELHWGDLAFLGPEGVAILAERSAYFHQQNPIYLSAPRLSSEEVRRSSDQRNADALLIIHPQSRAQMLATLSALPPQEIVTQIARMQIDSDEMRSALNSALRTDNSLFAQLWRVYARLNTVSSDADLPNPWQRGLARIQDQLRQDLTREGVGANLEMPIVNHVVLERLQNFGDQGAVTGDDRLYQYRFIQDYLQFASTQQNPTSEMRELIARARIVTDPQYEEGRQAWFSQESENIPDGADSVMDGLGDMAARLEQLNAPQQ